MYLPSKGLQPPILLKNSHSTFFNIGGAVNSHAFVILASVSSSVLPTILKSCCLRLPQTKGKKQNVEISDDIEDHLSGPRHVNFGVSYLETDMCEIHTNVTF